MGNLPLGIIIAIIGLVVGLPSCMNASLQLKDRWRGKPMVEGSSSRQATSPSLLIFNIIGASLVLGGAYLIWAGDGQKEGFYKGWPDAIRCTWAAPGDGVPSEYAFYYRGSQANNGLGSTRAYFLVGSPKEPAKFHELWLSEGSRSLITPDQLPDDPNNITYKYYKAAFLPGKIDCGGKTIEEMVANGHAFTFARPAK